MMEMVTGVLPPGGQLSGGTNNPSKGMTFAFNGTGIVRRKQSASRVSMP